MMIDAEPDLTAFAAFPREHWTKIWSNNPIERLNREWSARCFSDRGFWWSQAACFWLLSSCSTSLGVR